MPMVYRYFPSGFCVPRSLWILGLLFGLSFGLGGCKTAPRQPSNQTPVLPALEGATDAEADEFRRMERTYQAKDFEQTLQLTRGFLNRRPKSGILDHVHHLRGLAFVGQKQFAYAIINFKKTLNLTQRPTLKSSALFNKALTEVELGQTEEARQTLAGLPSEALSIADRQKYFILQAKVFHRLSLPVEASRATLSAIRVQPPSSQNDPSSLVRFLDDNLAKIQQASLLEGIATDFDDSPALDSVWNRLALINQSQDRMEPAKAWALRIQQRFPSSSYLGGLSALIPTQRPDSHIHRGASDRDIQGRKLGVILTLSGPFSAYGYRSLQGIELAARVFKGSDTTTGGVTLVIRDDKGDPQTAIQALDDLVANQKVTAIVGPMVSKLAEPVAKRAQELGVPLILLTQKNVGELDYVFNAALTPQMQAQALVDYAVTKLNIKRFGMMAPSGKFGDEYRKAFWDELESRNQQVSSTDQKLQVRAHEIYPSGETDFRQYVDKMVGLAPEDIRTRELQAIKAKLESENQRVPAKRLQKMISLKPVIDFQAVFIPDDPKALGQLLPTFAYRDVDRMVFLGINTWNSPELLARSGEHAEGAIFVDAFFPESSKPLSQKFTRDYRDTFRMDPSSLEALAYDAANIAVHFLHEGVDSRSEMRAKIASLRGFPGVTGQISCQNGRLVKELALLTVKGGKIEEIADR